MNNKKSTRTSFAEALLKIGERDPKVVTVAADSASRYGSFPEKFPNRSFNVGIAEQTMVDVAAGLALSGKIPVIASYANFLAFRALEQIRVDIASSNLNIKMVGTDTGFSSEWLGFTHLALEDMAAIRSLPNITIIDPADAEETYEATKSIFEYEGPVYMRIRGRKEEPVIPFQDKSFKIGKGKLLAKGQDIIIVACGNAVYECYKAGQILKAKGINATIVDMATIRPLDKKLLLELTASIKNMITVEHHNIIGGLGSSIAEFISENKINMNFKRFGVKDKFGTAGTEDMLKKNFGLDSESLASEIDKFLS